MVIPSAIRSQETKLESDQDHSIKAIIVKRHLKENQERIVSPNNDRQEQIRGGTSSTIETYYQVRQNCFIPTPTKSRFV